MSEPLHFKLKSGRIFLLNVPFTPDELAEAQTDEGNAYLEQIADDIESRNPEGISSESEEGKAMLKQHGIQPPTE